MGKILGQQHTGQTGEKKTVLLQTEEQRSGRACALTARGSISKAVEGLVGGAATGAAECRKHWIAALILRSLGQDTRPSNAERTQTTQAAW